MSIPGSTKSSSHGVSGGSSLLSSGLDEISFMTVVHRFDLHGTVVDGLAGTVCARSALTMFFQSRTSVSRRPWSPDPTTQISSCLIPGLRVGHRAICATDRPNRGMVAHVAEG